MLAPKIHEVWGILQNSRRCLQLPVPIYRMKNFSVAKNAALASKILCGLKLHLGWGHTLWFRRGCHFPPHASRQWLCEIAGDVTVFWQSRTAIGGPHACHGLVHVATGAHGPSLIQPFLFIWLEWIPSK